MHPKQIRTRTKRLETAPTVWRLVVSLPRPLKKDHRKDHPQMTCLDAEGVIYAERDLGDVES
jgi:hypothetical protein